MKTTWCLIIALVPAVQGLLATTLADGLSDLKKIRRFLKRQIKD